MKKVVIVQFQFPHYRSKFYMNLRDELLSKGVEVDIICAEGHSIAAVKGESDVVSKVKSKKFKGLYYQPVLGRVKGAELVILQSELKYVHNYFIYLWSWVLRGPKIAFWGHGKNFQNLNDDKWTEKLRRFFSRRVHWWFAYNDLCVKIVRNMGFPEKKITNVRNSIDMKLIRSQIDMCPDDKVEALKKELGIDSENIAIYTGRFMGIKRIPFILESAVEIRKIVPDFHLILVGNGVQQDLVDSYAIEHPWIHPVGAKNDIEKIPYWKMSKILLMPGAVGLVVLDTFVFGVPMVTTAIPNHGPEIDYTVEDENVVIVKEHDCTLSYARKAGDLLHDKERLNQLRDNCLIESEKYSSEEMARRFAEGVGEALNL